jgi:carboxymethylenebutenolidase
LIDVRVIDWLLPGIPPTGKKVEIPMIGIINFRGAKLCREHLYWYFVCRLAENRDQASVLVQIGLLEKGRLPICGVEAAIKVLDETSVPSNQLMPNWEESEGKPI